MMVVAELLLHLLPHYYNLAKWGEWLLGRIGRKRQYTRFAWAGGTCPRFGWAGGTYFPVSCAVVSVFGSGGK